MRFIEAVAQHEVHGIEDLGSHLVLAHLVEVNDASERFKVLEAEHFEFDEGAWYSGLRLLDGKV